MKSNVSAQSEKCIPFFFWFTVISESHPRLASVLVLAVWLMLEKRKNMKLSKQLKERK